MKKNLYLITIVLLAGLCSKAQNLVNQGVIRINPGSVVVINGNFRNESSGSLNNSGNIIVTGNWTNNATSGNLLQGTNGTVSFNGISVQSVGGTTRTWFTNINLNNNITLNNLNSVSGALVFAGKKITLGSHNLFMLSGSTITGHGVSAYVVATGSGQLFRQVAASNVEFPVGTSTGYAPVVLNNSGVSDNYGVNVFPDVRANGLTGSTIPEISHCVNITWNITEELAGGSNLSVTPYWSAAIEGLNFNRAQAGIGHYTSGAWNAQEAQQAAGANPYSLTRTGITSLSAFAVGDIDSPLASEPIPPYISVENVTLAFGDNVCYEATQTITVAGDGTTFTVENGAEAHFVAGMNILFLPGTTIESGGYMHARISSDNTYCSNPESLVAALTPESRSIQEEMNEVNADSGIFRIYPNPGTGNFWIEFTASQNRILHFEVFNTLGAKVKDVKHDNGTTMMLDLSDQARGLYFIRLYDGKSIFTEKLLLQ